MVLLEVCIEHVSVDMNLREGLDHEQHLISFYYHNVVGEF